MTSNLKINVGCGRNPLAGYLNIDLRRYNDVDYSGGWFLLMDARREFVGWINRETSVLDHRILPHEVIEEIRCDQFLEHLTLSEGQSFLATCCSALHSQGVSNLGVLRLSVPNFAAHIADYIERKQRVFIVNPQLEEYKGPFRQEVNILHSVIHGFGHKMFYDQEMLRTVLEIAGFHIADMRTDESNIYVIAV